MARVVVSGVRHHVTQRGNRRERIFFAAGGYLFYAAVQRGRVLDPIR